jgi:hypothetical protein
MVNDLLYRLGIKKKRTRTEKVKDAFSEAIHTVADSLDEIKAESRKRTVETREHATGAISKGVDATSARSAAMLAALGALTADWDDIAKSLADQMTERIPSGEEVQAASTRAGKAARKAVGRKRKRRRYPGFWLWLLRLGTGFWFIEHLRDTDMAAYIDHGAEDRMRQASEGHPVAWYKDLLDNTFIPNASFFAAGEIVATALAAVGYITGANRRLAALLGLLTTSNYLLLDYQDADKRGQNLVLLLAQLLLFRTGS